MRADVVNNAILEAMKDEDFTVLFKAVKKYREARDHYNAVFCVSPEEAFLAHETRKEALDGAWKAIKKASNKYGHILAYDTELNTTGGKNAVLREIFQVMKNMKPALAQAM